MSFFNEYSIKKLEDIKTIYLALDDDPNGIRMRNELARRLGKVRCKIVTYNNLKDLNDVLVKHGEKVAQECFKEAKLFPIEGIITVGDVRENVKRLRTKGFERGQLIGIPEIDRIHSIKPKLMTISTGYPGSGKSTWWRWYLTELVKNNPKTHNHVVIYAPEDRPVERTIALFAQIYVKKRFAENEWNSMNNDEYEEALDWVEEHFTFLSPFSLKTKKINLYGKEINAPNSHDGILELTRVCVEQKGANILLIDSYAKFDHQRGRESETDYISRMLDTQLEFNHKYDINTTFIAHPKGTNELDSLGNHSRLPTLSDVSGGAHWDNKADTGIVLGRDKWVLDENEQPSKNYNSDTTIKSVKHKFLEVGEEGITRMYMDYWAGEIFISDRHKKVLSPTDKKTIEKAIVKQKQDNAEDTAKKNQTELLPNTEFNEDISDMPF